MLKSTWNAVAICFHFNIVTYVPCETEWSHIWMQAGILNTTGTHSSGLEAEGQADTAEDLHIFPI